MRVLLQLSCNCIYISINYSMICCQSTVVIILDLMLNRHSNHGHNSYFSSTLYSSPSLMFSCTDIITRWIPLFGGGMPMHSCLPVTSNSGVSMVSVLVLPGGPAIAEPRLVHTTWAPRQLHSSRHWKRTGLLALTLALTVLISIGDADILKMSAVKNVHFTFRTERERERERERVTYPSEIQRQLVILKQILVHQYSDTRRHALIHQSL